MKQAGSLKMGQQLSLDALGQWPRQVSSSRFFACAQAFVALQRQKSNRILDEALP
jgi:hypothetical protein